MSEIEVQKNNPLHGLKLEVLLTELVDHYGWEVLASVLKMHCFSSNPSIKSSLKFLRKTTWAREKTENFYLYKFKRLPRPSDEEFTIPPRDRIIPLNQRPGKPMVFSVEGRSERRSQPSVAPKVYRRDNLAEEQKPVDRARGSDKGFMSEKDSTGEKDSSSTKEKDTSSANSKVDPWAKWRE
ncbi:uncharacterized protein (DUF2132 family) [Sinobacterium caligoides]|uniref:Uncharacterized protein (DUF2132 family) n=1 Tax=Sinobacterium caligoides TaxID=933926 RepID=A0A3N2E069_9GAMM|nr:uncharacterized protein (DUF2132 family) [Sinobacterium caligoides]